MSDLVFKYLTFNIDMSTVEQLVEEVSRCHPRWSKESWAKALDPEIVAAQRDDHYFSRMPSESLLEPIAVELRIFAE